MLALNMLGLFEDLIGLFVDGFAFNCVACRYDWGNIERNHFDSIK